MRLSDKRRPQENLTLRYFIVRFFLGFFIGLLALLFYNHHYFDRLELLALDLRFKLRSPHPTSSDIAIIEISDDSIAALGRWPWPRRYHAALLNILNKYNAKLIGFDIIFSEPTDQDDDELFTQALKANHNTRLAFSYNTNQKGLDLTSKIVPLDIFIPFCKDTAFINIEPDSDGKIRFADLYIREKDKINYNFSLSLALDFLGADLNKLVINDSSIIVPLKEDRIMYIPVDKNGKMLINWPGYWTKTFKHYSFFDILQSYQDEALGQAPFLDLNELRDKICLVGVTATGLGDIKSVSIEPLYPGIGIHASIINSILNNDFITKTPDSLNILIIFIFALGLPFFISRVKVFRGALIILLLIVMLWYLSFILFENKNIWLNFIYPAFTIIFVYIMITLYNEIVLAREKVRLFKASTVDGLTSLYNKSYFTFLLQAELSAMRLRSSKNLAVIMADIDHFKSVNDTFGHQIGDLILREVASVFSEGSRPQDVIGRFGGEEIIMLLRNTDLGVAYQVAQRIRKTVEAYEFKDSQNTYRITISMGVATFRENDTIESIVKRADDALYQAKQEGRNRVCQEKPA